MQDKEENDEQEKEKDIENIKNDIKKFETEYNRDKEDKEEEEKKLDPQAALSDHSDHNLSEFQVVPKFRRVKAFKSPKILSRLMGSKKKKKTKKTTRSMKK